MRTVVLRVVALALLLLLALFGAIALRTLARLPNTTLYFVKEKGTNFTLAAEHRRSGDADPTERAAWQVAALAAGPATAGELSTTVPPGTRLLHATFQGGVLTVDLNSEFESGGGTSSMLGRLNQLFYTLTQPKGVEAVRLLVEGRPVTVFAGEGLMVPQPWVREDSRALPTW